MARKHAVEKWILPALLELCERPEPLSLEEARLMDFDDVVLVGSVRQTVRPSTLAVNGTGVGNIVRAWMSGEPCSSVPDSSNNPVQTHLPQSGIPPPTLKPTGQPGLFNKTSVSTLPTCAGDGPFWGAAAASVGAKNKKGRKGG